MPAFDLYIPKYNSDQQKTLKDLYNAYVENTQQLQWLLSHLDEKNVLRAKKAFIADLYAGNITTDQIIAGTAKISLALIEDIVAENIITNTIVTQTLYAEKADIAELTVDRLDTSDKVRNYLDGNKDDVNYQRIYDQHFEWITAKYKGDLEYQIWQTYPQTPVTGYPYQAIINAGGNIRLLVSTNPWYYHFSGDTQLKSSTAGKMYQLSGGAWSYVSDATNYSYTSILQSNNPVYNDVSLTTVLFAATTSLEQYEQLVDRNGQPVYWIDEEHKGTTLTANQYPVYVYKYDELVKLKISFELVDGVYTPVMTWGAGVGNTEHPERGRGYDFKDTLGRVMRYIRADGVVQDIRNGENGIEFLGDTSNNYYSATNADPVTIGTTETTVCEKQIAFNSRSKVVIHFSCKLTTTGGAVVKAKTYIGSTAWDMEPESYAGSANKWTLSYSDDKKGIGAGTKTIAVKIATDANGGTIAAKQSKLIIYVLPDPMPALPNVTGFTATTVNATQINLAWTNP